MLNPYLLITSLQDKTPQHLFDTAVVALGLAICLWMMAGTKEAFGSHVRPKGLPKCTCEPRILVMYHQQRHAIVLPDDLNQKNGWPPPPHQDGNQPEKKG